MKHSLHVLLIGGMFTAGLGLSQTPRGPTQQQDPNVATGVVVSSSASTMVVRTESGQHVLFVLEPETAKPKTTPRGAKVTVRSRPDPEGNRVATSVTVTSPPRTEEGASAETAEPIPEDIRRLERQIERQVRRFGAGVRAGVGLDPEILTAGVHAKLGPFFHRDVFLRPNAEFGFGEVTTLAALNFEAVYRLPITERQSRWSVYVGAGPGFNFIDRGFEADEGEGEDTTFDDFDFDGSLNILAGVEFRNGMFLEIKSTAYSRPHTRLLIGYSF